MSRTPYRRSRYRRAKQRIGFAATMSLIVFGAIFGAAIVILSSPKAHSDPGALDTQASTYAVTHASAICGTIAKYPSASGVAGVVDAITDDGLNGYQAGQAIGLAVTAQCPQYWPVLDTFIAATKTPSTPSPVRQTPATTGTGVLA